MAATAPGSPPSVGHSLRVEIDCASNMWLRRSVVVDSDDLAALRRHELDIPRGTGLLLEP